MPRRHLLAFDGRKSTGVREHFFHFLLGYLLPAVHVILDDRSSREDEFIFVSCGPMMDEKTVEMARLLGIRYGIVPHEDAGRILGTTRVTVPRWDSFVCSRATYSTLDPGTAVLKLLHEAV